MDIYKTLRSAFLAASLAVLPCACGDGCSYSGNHNVSMNSQTQTPVVARVINQADLEKKL